jgi:hypothetical protein
VANGQAPAAAKHTAPATTVVRTPNEAASRPENSEIIPAVIGPGAMPAAACRTEKCHSAVNGSVMPNSIAAKPV